MGHSLKADDDEDALWLRHNPLPSPGELLRPLGAVSCANESDASPLATGCAELVTGLSARKDTIGFGIYRRCLQKTEQFMPFRLLLSWHEFLGLLCFLSPTLANQSEHWR